MARTPKPSSADLASSVMAEAYDHTYLAAHFAFALANIADGNHPGRAKTYARTQLEQLADYDSFVADNPAARKPGA